METYDERLSPELVSGYRTPPRERAPDAPRKRRERSRSPAGPTGEDPPEGEDPFADEFKEVAESEEEEVVRECDCLGVGCQTCFSIFVKGWDVLSDDAKRLLTKDIYNAMDKDYKHKAWLVVAQFAREGRQSIDNFVEAVHRCGEWAMMIRLQSGLLWDLAQANLVKKRELLERALPPGMPRSRRRRV